jgi:dTDP-4-amino-4,6-dideoxygalactose transaminase
MQQSLAAAHHDARELEECVERRVCEIVVRPHGVAFGSTGAAIESALIALGAACGAEIVIPALAPAILGASAARVGARCAFADVDPKSLTLRDLHGAARVTSATRAIVGVASHGQPAGLNELAALASRNELPLLEIVCGGLGGRIGRDPVGRFGRIAVVALGPHESPIGSGGAVCVTNDERLAHTMRLLRNTGQNEPRTAWERAGGIRMVERIGTDARMNPLQAALADVRLARFDETAAALHDLFHAYLRRLATHPELVLPAPCADGTVQWSHFAVRLSERYSRDDRDSIMQGLLRHDIAATSVVHVLPHEPAFASGHRAGDFPVAERAADRLIALPFSTRLHERDIDLIAQTLQVMIERQSLLRGN